VVLYLLREEHRFYVVLHQLQIVHYYRRYSPG
jgi:hypothetical protein